MYSKFIFQKIDGKNSKNKEIHPYRVFFDPLTLDDGDLSELRWMSKLKIDQACLVAKSEDPILDSFSTMKVHICPHCGNTINGCVWTLHGDKALQVTRSWHEDTSDGWGFY